MNFRYTTTALLLLTIFTSPVHGAEDGGTSTKIAAEANEDAKAAAQRIGTLIKKRKFEDAEAAFQKAIAEHPAEIELQELRTKLVVGLVRLRKYTEAFAHAETALQSQLDKADSQTSPTEIVSALSLVTLCAIQAKRRDQASEMLDQAYEKMREITAGDAVRRATAMSRIVPLKASALSRAKETEAARAVISKHVSEIDNIESTDANAVALLIAKSRLLYANVAVTGATKEDAETLDEFIDQAITQDPSNLELLKEYSRANMMILMRTFSNKPKEAKKRAEKLTEMISTAAQDNAYFKGQLRQLKILEPRIASMLELTKLVGKQAPPLDIDAWINQGNVTEESLQGKVLMIDFWSVWCGPCIMTFPHLREWHDEFRDQGFEIIGVTQYYNYRWDEASDRPERVTETVDPADERAMLEKFMRKHQLPNPAIVTPRESKMQESFGVTGIPHVVLVDRKGIVRKVKVGAGDAVTKDIYRTIKELVSE